MALFMTDSSAVFYTVATVEIKKEEVRLIRSDTSDSAVVILNNSFEVIMKIKWSYT